MTKRLYRSRRERMITGVCGGLAEYFGIDPTIIRVIWVFATIMTGVIPGIIVYLILALIIPLEPAAGA